MSSKLAPVIRLPKARVVERESELLARCRGKTVLHLGCADVPYTLERGKNLLHRRLHEVADDLWGIDTDQHGCTLLRKMGFANILTGDLSEDHSALLQEQHFDIILAGEVIEHVENTGAFLAAIKEVMHVHSELILTTVNTPTFVNIVYGLLRREKVHPDHNYYFSYRTLKTLVEKQGLRVVEIYYYQVLNTPTDRFMSPLKKIWPNLADGLILRARV